MSGPTGSRVLIRVLRAAPVSAGARSPADSGVRFPAEPGFRRTPVSAGVPQIRWKIVTSRNYTLQIRRVFFHLKAIFRAISACQTEAAPARGPGQRRARSSGRHRSGGGLPGKPRGLAALLEAAEHQRQNHQNHYEYQQPQKAAHSPRLRPAPPPPAPRITIDTLRPAIAAKQIPVHSRYVPNQHKICLPEPGEPASRSAARARPRPTSPVGRCRRPRPPPSATAAARRRTRGKLCS